MGKFDGPKHLGPSYICELSLHKKFQSPSITPSHKKAGEADRRKKKERKEKKLFQWPLREAFKTQNRENLGKIPNPP